MKETNKKIVETELKDGRKFLITFINPGFINKETTCICDLCPEEKRCLNYSDPEFPDEPNLRFGDFCTRLGDMQDWESEEERIRWMCVEEGTFENLEKSGIIKFVNDNNHETEQNTKD